MKSLFINTRNKFHFGLKSLIFDPKMLENAIKWGKIRDFLVKRKRGQSPFHISKKIII